MKISFTKNGKDDVRGNGFIVNVTTDDGVTFGTAIQHEGTPTDEQVKKFWEETRSAKMNGVNLWWVEAEAVTVTAPVVNTCTDMVVTSSLSSSIEKPLDKTVEPFYGDGH